MTGARETDALAVARPLAERAGLATPVEVVRLTGGRNNRMFRVALADGSAVAMKLYHVDPGDRRDRIATEWRFLDYAWAKGVRLVPRPLARDEEHKATLMAYVEGDKLAVEEIGPRHVDAAVSFILALNAQPRETHLLDPASEACFSMAEHVATVDARVERLAQLDRDAPMRAQAERLVEADLAPRWRELRDRIVAEAETRGIPLEARIDPGEECVSPSDFGFHNMLWRGDAVTVLDFEYAGRDDPAKLICDFLCQPEIPVPPELHERFRDGILDGLGLADRHALRADMLLDAYRVKWVCIMLNDFLPQGARRRAFADRDAWIDRCERQLARAEASLAQITRV